jgi:dienelactone hydrolase
VNAGVAAEEPEYDVAVQQWDGRALRFTRTSSNWSQAFRGSVDGRTLIGTMLDSSDPTTSVPFSGTRAEVLGYGLSPRDAAARADWQTRTRRQLAHLMMADNPAPLSLSVAHQSVDLAPSGDGAADDRDDDANSYNASYTVDELSLQAMLPNPYGNAPLTRLAHGYLATPTGSAPAGGWPAMVVLNGHDSSALGTLNAYDPMYWYGDAWARRGFVVLALDVGHRPIEDRQWLYSDYVVGDRPGDGNGPHPAIKAAGLDSDWAEDGERIWDVERGIDYLLTLGIVDASRLTVTGLSMGGAIATMTAALDGRVAAVIPAGYTPDLTVMAGHGNHPCWLWTAGDPLDYFSVAELHALIAPRPLVAEVGLADDVFSDYQPPFIGEKEITRRSRAAFADAPDRFVVYLHPGGHEYRFGDVFVTSGAGPLFVAAPVANAPRWAGDLGWSSDDATTSLGVTLADQLARMLPAQ